MFKSAIMEVELGDGGKHNKTSSLVVMKLFLVKLHNLVPEVFT